LESGERIHGINMQAQIKTTQDLSTLIRDLQELWLFGGLDTLTDPADEEANRTKAIQIAEMVERLAGTRTVGAKKKETKQEGDEES
jgi:hypothetical protein